MPFLERLHKVMIVAGEASGDRIASRAIHATRRLAESRGDGIEFYGIAGSESKRQGMRLFRTVEEMSVVGFVEVAKRVQHFRKVLKEMEYLLTSARTRPNVLVLIDYPGFNIRLARKARALGIRVIYYVSPQVWAWHKSRVDELKQVVDEMLVIFPFEEQIYRDAGMTNVQFVGHPLLESIDHEAKHFSSRREFAKAYNLDAERDWLVVFSGSRSEEVRRLAPVMTAAAAVLEDQLGLQTILVEAGSIEQSVYASFTKGNPLRFRDSDHTHELMYHSALGILKSGTTTLEAALLGLPGVICYRTHPLTFAIGKRVVKLPYIGLANIVLGKKLYPELLQSECTAENIVQAATEIYRRRIPFREALEGLRHKLVAGSEQPSALVAKTILG